MLEFPNITELLTDKARTWIKVTHLWKSRWLSMYWELTVFQIMSTAVDKVKKINMGHILWKIQFYPVPLNLNIRYLLLFSY